MNWTHLLLGLIAVGWVVSVEYRLWANLRILSERFKGERPSHLHAAK